MLLIIGGSGAGKRDYVNSLGFDASEVLECRPEMREHLLSALPEEGSEREPAQAFSEALEELFAGYSVIYGLQELVFVAPLEVEACIAEWVKVLSSKAVVVCDEVGSGIIPGEFCVRKGREVTGRLCVLLAKQAERVERVVCGFVQVIKEN